MREEDQRANGTADRRWRVSWSYALLALGSFLFAGISILLPRLGPPMIFAFCTLCSVFLIFGAIQWKTERRDP